MKTVSILIDSFLESGYVFHKRSLFFWKKQENHGVFFDFWQRYMVAKKVLLTVCRFSLCSLKKREKWFRIWNSGEFFFRQPEYTYILFGRTAFIQKKDASSNALFIAEPSPSFLGYYRGYIFFWLFSKNADQNGVSCFICLMREITTLGSSTNFFSIFYVFFAPNVPFIAYMPYRRLLLVFRDWV